MTNAQKKNAAGGSSTRRNRPPKPQLKLLTCVAWIRSVKSTGRFKHHKRNHEGEVRQSDATNRVAQSSFSAAWETAEVFFYFLLAHHSFSNLCQSTGERWADEREKKEVRARGKKLLMCPIVEERLEIKKKKKKKRAAASRNECKR